MAAPLGVSSPPFFFLPDLSWGVSTPCFCASGTPLLPYSIQTHTQLLTGVLIYRDEAKLLDMKYHHMQRQPMHPHKETMSRCLNGVHEPACGSNFVKTDNNDYSRNECNTICLHTQMIALCKHTETHLLLLWGVGDLLNGRDSTVLFAGIGKALQVLHIHLIWTQPRPAQTHYLVSRKALARHD